jgi:uncharacterized phage protein (TIGR02220 family)
MSGCEQPDRCFQTNLFENKEVTDNCNGNLYVTYIRKFNEIRKTKYTAKVEKTKKQFVARLKEGFTLENMLEALKNAMQDKFHIDNSFKFLTPEFFTRSDKIEKYLNQQTKDSFAEKMKKKYGIK